MATPFHAVVSDVVTVSPSFIRVTVEDLDVDNFAYTGYDQWFRLFLPQDGQERPVFPQPEPGQRLWEAYYAMPEETRPVVRNYTVRRAYPERRAIDIDFVIHGDEGPASRWAQTVTPGAVIGILDQDTMFTPHDDTDWLLLVADETGLPAVAGVIDSIGDRLPFHAYIETPEAADVQHIAVPDGATLEWRHRDEPGATVHRPAVDSEQLQKAVESASFPPGRVQALVVGESSMVRAVRRHLVNDRGVGKDQVTFCGFWRHHTTPAPTGDEE
ncbi:NADPH-dependent ferric siderophore reductase [Stackebrandtia endophytica]|uniref:NADPH-dependent ferric siderophore reductase n=1 Tax=Stackebrandtia endophytica TaxID=1496996 RepID=A0A543AQQ4_9ACTN|nr:siderophore-interacting protein [Stackebrandtia endophytica]TQL74865.1 NADPH-dependent ferric siderophore reductase [Stackebrandtia endophytica]